MTPISEAANAPTARSVGFAVAFALGVLTVFGPASMDLYLPVLPALADDLGSSASFAQITMTTCLLGLAFGQLIAGPLADRYGRRRPLLTAAVLYTLASLLCAISPSIEVLVGARLLQGLCGGAGLVIAQAIGRDVYEGERLSRYYGRVVVLSGLAAIVAPVLGGQLAAVMSWRGFFLVLAGFGIVVLVVSATILRESLPTEERRPGGAREIRRALSELLRDPLFVVSAVSSALTSAAYFAYLAAGPFILQDVFGLSPSGYSLVFACGALSFALFGFLAGRAAERIGHLRVFAIGLAMMGVASGTLVVASALPQLVVVVVAFLLLAAGAAVVAPPSTTMALMHYRHIAGTAASVLGVVRFGAGALAAPLVGLGGSHAIAPLAVVCCVSIAAGSLILALWARRRPVRAR